MSPMQPVCSIFTEDIKPRNIPAGAVRGVMQVPTYTLASEALTHPAQGTAKNMNSTGLSDLEKIEKSKFVKTKKNTLTVPIAQLHVCLLLPYRNGVIFLLHALMKLEKDVNLGHEEVGRFIYSTQEKLYVLDRRLINFQKRVVTVDREQLDSGNNSASFWLRSPAGRGRQW